MVAALRLDGAAPLLSACKEIYKTSIPGFGENSTVFMSEGRHFACDVNFPWKEEMSLKTKI